MWAFRLNGWTRYAIISGRWHRRATCRCLSTTETWSSQAQSLLHKTSPCVVRFAPSPTGELHLGGLRTAIFNWLLARSSGGKFILRIEDTDKSREVVGAGDNIIQILTWTGLNWDEGPLRQSDRLDIYQRHGHHLLEIGSAYRCFCPPAQQQKPESGKQVNDHGRCPNQECVYLSKENVQHNLSTGMPFTIRLKVGDTVRREIPCSDIAV